jgi:hypothetical protein
MTASHTASVSLICCSVFVVWLPNSIFGPVQYNFFCRHKDFTCIYGRNHCQWIQYDPIRPILTLRCHVFTVVTTADESNTIRPNHFWHQDITYRGVCVPKRSGSRSDGFIVVFYNYTHEIKSLTLQLFSCLLNSLRPTASHITLWL